MATRNTGGTDKPTGTGKAGAGRKSAAKKTGARPTTPDTGTPAPNVGTTKAGSSRTTGSATRKTAGTARKSSTAKTAGARAGKSTLQADLREFVQQNPGGWGHNEWIGLVNRLRDRGHDTSDTDAIGMALERERLILTLERVPGLGPQRVKALADKYPRVWNLMQANADEIAAAANLPRTVAEKIRQALS